MKCFDTGILYIRQDYFFSFCFDFKCDFAKLFAYFLNSQNCIFNKIKLHYLCIFISCTDAKI